MQHQPQIPPENEQEEHEKPQTGLFGLPRTVVYAGAFGAAGGYVLCGVIGLVTGTMPNLSVPVVLCALASGGAVALWQKWRKRT